MFDNTVESPRATRIQLDRRPCRQFSSPLHARFDDKISPARNGLISNDMGKIMRL